MSCANFKYFSLIFFENPSNCVTEKICYAHKQLAKVFKNLKKRIVMTVGDIANRGTDFVFYAKCIGVAALIFVTYKAIKNFCGR